MNRSELDVLAERARQREVHGDDHDDRAHGGGALALAAGTIARPDAADHDPLPGAPDWTREYMRRGYRERLVIGAALLLAELDRHDRFMARRRRDGASVAVVDHENARKADCQTCGDVRWVSLVDEESNKPLGFGVCPKCNAQGQSREIPSDVLFVHTLRINPRGLPGQGQRAISRGDAPQGFSISGRYFPGPAPRTPVREPVDGYPQFGKLVWPDGHHEWVDPDNLDPKVVQHIRDARVLGAVLHPPANGRRDFEQIEVPTRPPASDVTVEVPPDAATNRGAPEVGQLSSAFGIPTVPPEPPPEPRIVGSALGLPIVVDPDAPPESMRLIRMPPSWLPPSTCEVCDGLQGVEVVYPGTKVAPRIDNCPKCNADGIHAIDGSRPLRKMAGPRCQEVVHVREVATDTRVEVGCLLPPGHVGEAYHFGRWNLDSEIEWHVASGTGHFALRAPEGWEAFDPATVDEPPLGRNGDGT